MLAFCIAQSMASGLTPPRTDRTVPNMDWARESGKGRGPPSFTNFLQKQALRCEVRASHPALERRIARCVRIVANGPGTGGILSQRTLAKLAVPPAAGARRRGGSGEGRRESSHAGRVSYRSGCRTGVFGCLGGALNFVRLVNCHRNCFPGIVMSPELCVPGIVPESVVSPELRGTL
jgi:hypothetical protein